MGGSSWWSPTPATRRFPCSGATPAPAATTSRGISGREPLNVVTIADVNADGWPDIVGVATSRNRLVIYRNGPTGLTYPLKAVQTGASPRGVAVGDFNADGRRRSRGCQPRRQQRHDVLTQQADGSFALQADELHRQEAAPAPWPPATSITTPKWTLRPATNSPLRWVCFTNRRGQPRAAYAFTPQEPARIAQDRLVEA